MRISLKNCSNSGISAALDSPWPFQRAASNRKLESSDGLLHGFFVLTAFSLRPIREKSNEPVPVAIEFFAQFMKDQSQPPPEIE